MFLGRRRRRGVPRLLLLWHSVGIRIVCPGKQPLPSPCNQCCLTPRSSGAPTAGHQARAGGTPYIFTGPGLASCRWRPLSSNVRPRNEQTSAPASRSSRSRSPFAASKRMRIDHENPNSVPTGSGLAQRPTDFGSAMAQEAVSSSSSRAASHASISKRRSARSLSSSLGSRATRRLSRPPKKCARPQRWAAGSTPPSSKGSPSVCSHTASVAFEAPGARPNPSLEPTSSGRPLGPAGASHFYFAPSGPSALPPGSAQLER
jgi:hypothetical protein